MKTDCWVESVLYSIRYMKDLTMPLVFKISEIYFIPLPDMEKTQTKLCLKHIYYLVWTAPTMLSLGIEVVFDSLSAIPLIPTVVISVVIASLNSIPAVLGVSSVIVAKAVVQFSPAMVVVSIAFVASVVVPVPSRFVVGHVGGIDVGCHVDDISVGCWHGRCETTEECKYSHLSYVLKSLT